MERFVLIVNGFQPLTIITERSILDVAAALDPPLRPTIIAFIKITLINTLMKHYVRIPIIYGYILILYIDKMQEYMGQRPCIPAFYSHVKVY